MAERLKFFSKKVVLITLAAVVALGGFIWLIVATMQPGFRSGITLAADYQAQTVSGNGTSAVMVDDYLYFIGDSIITDDITYGSNNYYKDNKMTAAGIYRLKVADALYHGEELLHYTYNNTYTDTNDGSEHEYQLGDDNYNLMTNATKVNDWDNLWQADCNLDPVVPKIAGHDNAAMWVFGRYLIYTTPNNLRDSAGNDRTDYLDFYRVDLDGNNHTLLYESVNPGVSLANKDFTVWANNLNDIYLLVKDGTTVKKINVLTKEVTEIATDVNNVVFPQATQYRRNSQNNSLGKVYGGVMSYVYYTKNREDDVQTTNKGNLMYRYQINQNNEPELIGDKCIDTRSTTFAPLAATVLPDGNAQFVFSTVELYGNLTADTAITKYHVATNDLENFTKTTFENLPGEAFGISEAITFVGNGYYFVNNTLYHCQITIDQQLSKFDYATKREVMSGVDSVVAVVGQRVYVMRGNYVAVINPNGVNDSITLHDSSDDDAEETAYQLTFTASVLLTTYADDQDGNEAGAPLVFAHDANSLRLFTSDGKTFAYLKIKEK